MSQTSSLMLKSRALTRLPPLSTRTSTFFLAKEKYALGTKDCDSSTSAKVGGAGLGRDHREWGQWREEGSARRKGRQILGKVLREWEREKSRESLPGGRWARPPPLQGPRSAGGPLPPGPARRPGRGREAPGRGGRARGRTLPTSAAARLSPKVGLSGPQAQGDLCQALAARLVPLTHPPPRSGHQPALRAPPTDTGCRKSSPGSRSRLPPLSFYPSHSSCLFIRALS